MSSILGVVELIPEGEHGPETYEFVRDEFKERVKTWLRPEDQLKVLSGERICVLLKRIACESQLDLATAKSN